VATEEGLGGGGGWDLGGMDLRGGGGLGDPDRDTDRDGADRGAGGDADRDGKGGNASSGCLLAPPTPEVRDLRREAGGDW